MAQALFFMEHAVSFIKTSLFQHHPFVEGKSKLSDSLKKKLLQVGLPFILGCDLSCNPDGAAYDVFMGKDIFEEGSTW